MNKTKGFTIIEILVTLVIFSIFLFVVLGMTMDQVGRAGLKGSANELIGAINTVRGRAAKENRFVALTFTDSTYTEHSYEPNKGAAIWSPPLSTNSPSAGRVSERTKISNSTTIAFNSQGILVDNTTFQIRGNIVITLNSHNMDGIKIKVYSHGGIKTRNTWRDTNEYPSF